MRYLYKYTFKPNYPVCEGYVLFHSSTAPAPAHWPNLLIEGKDLAEGVGAYYPNQDARCVYLGQLEPIASFKNLPILSCATGEY